MEEIKFNYKDSPECWKETKWEGCCCDCAHHAVVKSHCSHVIYEDTKKNCTCHRPLGFSICSAMIELGEVQVIGSHGYCELHEPKKVG